VEGNPVNFVDPLGLIKQNEVTDADIIVKELQLYNVYIRVDWGEVPDIGYFWLEPLLRKNCGWIEGEWEMKELNEIRKGVVDLIHAMGGLNNFIFNLGYVDIYKKALQNNDYVAVGDVHLIKVNNNRHDITHWAIVHEMAHAWDAKYGWEFSKALVSAISSVDPNTKPSTCDKDKRKPGCNDAGYIYGGIPAAGADANFNPKEDFSESVAAYVYPSEAQKKVQVYLHTNYQDLLYYKDYRTTLRWLFIKSLINTTKSYQ